ncbi:MAG: MerR family DNA-binding transcriptional regulator [Desulforegulaceae bacterium]|nr:MerR family DNA-binding transcriptional regulator [Desulforegulaceae bacterium]
MKKKKYSISELASELEISPSSIRFYEEKGIISPERTKGNQRIYSLKDRARLKLVLRGKRFGFSLSEISEMIGFADSEPEEKKQIQRSLEYAEKKLKEISQRKDELELVEKDLLEMRDKFIKRLANLEN